MWRQFRIFQDMAASDVALCNKTGLMIQLNGSFIFKNKSHFIVKSERSLVKLLVFVWKYGISVYRLLKLLFN